MGNYDIYLDFVPPYNLLLTTVQSYILLNNKNENVCVLSSSWREVPLYTEWQFYLNTDGTVDVYKVVKDTETLAIPASFQHHYKCKFLEFDIPPGC